MITVKKNNHYNLYYYDDEWQKPVITEYQTFKLLYENNNIPNNYFAFPWASLIDAKLKNMNMLDNFKINDKYCFTVIQHIHFRNYLHIIKKIGITHIFASHNQHGDDALEKKYNIKIIPYSLFPAQFDKNDFLSTNISENNQTANPPMRKYLTSFIGQYEEYYLSNIRVNIFNVFSKYFDSYIVRRTGWHYDGMVFKGIDTTEREAEEQEYKMILKESIFSLCPSGSGPNSIRIWESMGYGSIPVILADTLILPNIQNIDWNDYFVLWKESEINNLHDHLLTYSNEKIESMSKKNIELFNKYFSKDSMMNIIIDWYNSLLLSIPIISYCCATFPTIGGVARYDTQLKMIFPHRIWFQGSSEKDKMIEYLSTIKKQNPIVITDNHLACDIPNEYNVILVHHGSALTHAEREPTWDKYWKDLCCNGQLEMLFHRNPINTQIISISQFCTDEFTKYFGDRYKSFDNTLIPHTSEFNEEIYKTSFNENPIILGNWADNNKGGNIVNNLMNIIPKFKFQKLSININENESLNSFNERKQKIYLNADIFLQISLCEGNSYATLDALISGMVVIASNVGLFYKDLPEDCYVKLDWEKNNDIEYIKERIEYAWNNKDILGYNARKWYMENLKFSLWKTKMTHHIINFYDKMTPKIIIKENKDVQYDFYTNFLNKYDKYIHNVVMLNPSDADIGIFNTVFKHKNRNTKNINDWNLNNRNDEKYDLLLINHTMMYSNDPVKWFSNVFNSCKFVIITDLINRKRGGVPEDISDQFNTTTDLGDCMRYNFSHLNKLSKNKTNYDLSVYKNRIADIEFYNTNYTQEDKINFPETFICTFKGDYFHLLKKDKMIRIDDFPTGIRPIMNDIEPLYNILDEFETRKIFYILGIVPSLLTKDMICRLQKFKYMIPACHGYNHKYDILSQTLIAHNDLYNDFTCMTQFNEFENKSKNDIRTELNKAKDILSELSSTFIYIPPCNLLDNNTLEVLEELDCKYILGETDIISNNIPIVKSNFYGRINQLNENIDYKENVITLHVTWEYDELLRKKTITLDNWRAKLNLLQ